MIAGQITIQGFRAELRNGEAVVPDAEGKPTEQKTPLKIMTFKDVNSHLQVNIIFTPEQFDEFIENMSQGSSKIVRPADSRFKLPWLARNGGIRS